ncbi:sugar-phosphatase [Carnobacteriaceae bacterium zg-84]|uniref:sugar-phosphatase n=1 Tax=Granulicatella sp. zg-84 TaxID=2678503 RepID=UPI0013BF0BEE|nr:sugar-phosphatase [Granulicatella sp. zg-84]NEW65984.1 sugar-phosphatase [Granulicatella sp. zg-84]QMI85872.1 sugar-phosphatase [Carnobacteriaceae bacterium zg-84]
MTNIKMVAIDIDGTLLNSKGELTPKVKETIKKATQKGVKIVLCTGRPTKGVENLLNELDLMSDEQYVISYNGSLVQSTNKKQIVQSYSFTFKELDEIRELADTLQVHYHAAGDDALYTTNRMIGIYTAYESVLVNMPIAYRTIDELKNINLNPYKMMFVDEPHILDDVLLKIPQAIKEKYFLVKSAPFYLEILHKDANKGNAVAALATFLNIDLSQIMAIGDNDNDIDMIDVAGYGVAMGNAVDRVKEHATYMTTSNDEDGVAHILEELVL